MLLEAVKNKLSARIVQTVIDVPLSGMFDYVCTDISASAIKIGQRLLVPWGKQYKIGLAWNVTDTSLQPENKLKPILARLHDIPDLSPDWCRLISAVSEYYHKPLGEVALMALPILLRRAEGYQQADDGSWHSRSIHMLLKRTQRWINAPISVAAQNKAVPMLNPAQQIATARISAAFVSGFQRLLLHGVTGSGKTEVYLHAIAACLARGKQALLLVPEINLTPQLEKELQIRFPTTKIAILHSGRSHGERAMAWLAAQNGSAQLVVGTRLAVLTPLAKLGLVVVDEEHDPSYKQQEGVRYSARDIAILRAQQLNIPVVLGSATPALETWLHTKNQRYILLTLPERAVSAAQPPIIQLLDTRNGKLKNGVSQVAEKALEENLTTRQASLVFMNRRGYAPVLHCGECGWVSQCRHCSVYSVFHKADRRMHCHHCGWQAQVPKHCPSCGNLDLNALGYGTQRVEAYLAERFPQARLVRIDADSSKGKAGAQSLINKVHAGEADILIGTQMVAKGHDFQNLTLVVALNADSALFAQDFRAPERLFAQLMQVAGRAGRDGLPSRMLIQTQYPDHPLYTSLQAHDYQGFAQQQLRERQAANLPPYSYQVLLRAEAKELKQALTFLQFAQSVLPIANGLRAYNPVPLGVVRVADKERAQLLIECDSRRVLQHALAHWLPQLHTHKTRVRWAVDVDPTEV